MKKYFIFLTLFLLTYSAFAQLPKFNMQSQREKMIEQKNIHIKKMLQSESEKTQNQEEYDVKYYSLDLIPDPTTEILTGKVQIVGAVLSSGLNYVELNFINNMTIDGLYLTENPGTNLTYTHTNNILTVNLDQDYSQGQHFDFVVEYHGLPLYGFGFSSYHGSPMIWTLSQPYGARAWWPCKDIPSDKADSVDIRVTVPSELIVASNGVLRETIKEGANTTYWWHEKYPIVSYLVSLAIHPYTVEYDNYIYNDLADTMKIHFYMFPNHVNELQGINALIKDQIGFFSDIFGPYPYLDEKYGHADFLGGGAMEHQTCSSFSFWNEWVYAHELAHQWWGDLITCDTWHHIWLNEGFATYSEALWAEHAYGHIYGPHTASMYQLQESFYLGPGTIYVEDPLTQTIFSGALSYNKASWVLHMLRHVVGDTTFFEILSTYYNSPEHRFGTATTEEFQELCEQVSGMDLEYFFHQWIYESGYPIYEYAWTSTDLGDGTYRVEGYIDQIQTEYPLYKMPLDISIVSISVDTNIVTHTLMVDSQSQTFEFISNEEPDDVVLDIGWWVLKEVFLKNSPEIVYQNHSIDDSDGNNNNHWDAGETIQLFLEIDNLGLDAEDISITLATSHPLISIQNATVEFGNVGHREVASNESDPFVLSLSENAVGEFVSLVLDISAANGYTATDSFYIEVGKPHIILIDDDNGENYEQIIISYLKQSLIYTFNWDIHVDGLPADTLNDFDTMIWITGDDRESSLTSDEQALISTFINNGGKMLLSGQNIGYDLIEDGNENDSLFYSDYLKAEYITDTVEPTMVIGTPQDPISHGLFINFNAGHGGAGNQDSPDAILPLESAVQFLKYIPSFDGAGIYYENEVTGSKVIYVGFGIEGIDGPYEHSAVNFINKCVDWFSSTTEIDEINSIKPIPNSFELSQNYPNPFNPSTLISFSMPEKANITLTIYNIRGQKVKTLISEMKSAGFHQVSWDGRDQNGKDVSGGIYIYQLKSEFYTNSKKMLLLR